MPSLVLWAFGAQALWASVAPPSRRVDLPTLLAHAGQQASVEVARAQAAHAHARAQEVERMWIPRFDVSGVGGPSPRIQCLPSAGQCIATEPGTMRIGFAGGFWRVDAHLEMPLLTFGKLTAGKTAAREAAAAGDALAEGQDHAAALEAARAYFAVKLGRAMAAMLAEGRTHVAGAVAKQERLRAADAAEANEADRRRLLTLQAEIDARAAEAQRAVEVGLAGVHYVVGDADVDVDTAALSPLPFTLPERAAARRAAEVRPERRAAEAGAAAAGRKVALERAGFYPDLALVGGATLSRSSSVQHPRNAFMVDPYNNTSGALGLILRWAPDLGVRFSKVAEAAAEARRAEATAAMARHGLPAEAERAWADAHDAYLRRAAAQAGEGHAQAWLAGLVQAEAAGLAELHEVADALQQVFMMRARALQATFDWNVGVMALQRATGQRPHDPSGGGST